MLHNSFHYRSLVAVLGSLMLLACTREPVENPDPNHTHADVAVWMDGKHLDFSGEKYMTKELTPAEEDALAHETGSEMSLDKFLHLHDGNGHVIHRHKPGLTLANFFTSIRIGFTEECFTSGIPGEDGEVCPDHPFRFFVNGVERTFDDLSYVFADADHLLITNATEQVELQKELQIMTDDACMYSKTCPWRGEAPTENCIADPEVPCTE